MADLITVLLYVLATARLVQLIQKDELLRGPRNWWLKHSPKGSLRQYWITCTWCISAAAALAPAAAYTCTRDHPAALFLTTVLAFSWLAVVLKDVQALVFGKAVLYTPPDPEQAPTPEREAGH